MSKWSLSRIIIVIEVVLWNHTCLPAGARALGMPLCSRYEMAIISLVGKLDPTLSFHASVGWLYAQCTGLQQGQWHSEA